LDVCDVWSLHPGLWGNAFHERLEHMAFGLSARWRAEGDHGFCVNPHCGPHVPLGTAGGGPAERRRLAKEIENRTQAEAEIRSLNADLERRVEERTALLQRSNAALQRFAYVSSHDLQEPIRTIRTFNQLLAKEYSGKLDPKADQYIGFVVEASARMHNLVTDLMKYSRLLDPDAPKELKATSSGQALETALLDMQQAIQDSGAAVTYGALPEVSMDETQLQQLFQNLIGNAIKYRSPDRHLNVSITAERSESRWLFSVQDNGIGIEPQYFDQIFQAFKRPHGKEYPGSGVGLTICKEIVEASGGRMWVESELGRGSTFRFALPAANLTFAAIEQ
jgi:light-regulated signal transduction histidine kinase (bacteriophytochrome)